LVAVCMKVLSALIDQFGGQEAEKAHVSAVGFSN